MKKLIIAGGSGFLGEALIRYFEHQFDSIVVFTRSAEGINGKVLYRHWDAKSAGAWCKDIEGASVVINLCGKSVDCRYTKKNKAEILASRKHSTKIIGEAIASANTPPELWINGASATIYQHSEDIPMTEAEGKIGSGFSVDVCLAWEKEFNAMHLPATRKVNFRISMVLGTTGGVLPVLKGLVKKGLGGTMAKGTQQVSWVHIDDFCRSVEWAIKNTAAEGVYNIVAPEPVRNKVLMQLLRKLLNVPVGLPSSAWMLEIGAFFLRTETELILKSRFAFPKRLLDEGFTFKFPKIDPALKSLN